MNIHKSQRYAFLLIREYVTNAKNDITVKPQPLSVSLIAIAIPTHACMNL